MTEERSNPYVGIDAFTAKDKDYFFGRDREGRQLTSLVSARRVVLFYAQSGAGKTSLLQAKVIPELTKMAVLPIARVGGDLPGDVDVDEVENLYVLNTLIKLAGEGVAAGSLSRVGLVEGLEPYLTPPAGEERPRRTLLVLDQFEELFATYPARYPQLAGEQRAGFFRQLQDSLAAYPHLALLLTMREDYIAHLDYYAAMLPGRLRTRYRMERLTEQQAREAVIKPAEQAGRGFELEAAQKLVDDLRRIQLGTRRRQGRGTEQETLPEAAPAHEPPLGEYVEPLHLSVVCQRLWERIQPPPGASIRAQDVQESGDVDETLIGLYVDSLEKALEIVQDSGFDERQLRDWFDQKLITPAGTRGLVYHDEEQGETAGLPNAAVQVLADAYVIRSVKRGTGTWYELAHDRLVPPILQSNRAWYLARQAGIPWLRQAEEWKEEGEPDTLLLDGESLMLAERWRDEQSEPLASHEQRFLNRSREVHLDAAPWLRQAELWLKQGEPADLLLGAEHLPGATAWESQNRERLAPHEVRFLRLSREAFQEAERERAVEQGTNLADLGWGVIFAREDDGQLPDLRQALAELLNLRRQQAGGRYREFSGTDGYVPNEAAEDFLVKHGAGPGTADFDRVPYYLLIVGDPLAIPFEFQYALDVHHAVGRIHFDRLEDYFRYARSVVAAEQGGLALPRQAAFWGVQNPDDRSTALSTQGLLKPLSVKIAQEQPDWSVQVFVPDEAAPATMKRSMARLTDLVEVQPTGDASKAQLARLLGGDQTPSLLFTTSHGVSFARGHRRQLAHQGALVCQDWPGPEAWLGKGLLPEEFYFGASDVPDDARLLGLLVFFWASFTTGTPQLDDFAPHRTGEERTEIAPYPFVARLPQRLLAHPQGGALAVIGHVDRIWSYSFQTKGAGAQLAVFEEALRRLMDGHTVGSAMDRFNRQYALYSSLLVEELQQIEFGRRIDPLVLAEHWTRTIDARNYMILGDPAVRLPVVRGEASPLTRPALVTGGEGLLGPVVRLTETLRRLERRLEESVEGAASLEVQSYTAENMGRVPGDLEGAAEPRAQTRLALDGDVQVVAPMAPGEEGARLMRLHNEAVAVALEGRNAMLTAAASAADRLRGVPEVPEEPAPRSELEGVTHRIVR